MRIKSIQLKNIGVFKNEEIKFKKKTSKSKAEIHILTGPNGSGKSTLLYALASTFDHFEKGHANHVSNFFYKRFRHFKKVKGAYESEAVINIDGGYVKVYGCPNCKSIHSTTSNQKIRNYRNMIIDGPRENFSFEFIAFAYSGYRYIKSETINSVKDFAGNPLGQSLEFVKNRADDEAYDFSINQWIMNNLFKEAMALKFKDKDTATQLRQSLDNFKKLLSEIVGYEIGFNIDLNPTKLNVIIKGKAIDFDVLPDGLKSLISWIGDLMMVMDHVRWKDNISIFKRNMILFLDEIEVHLHPYWQRKVLPIVQKLFSNAQIFLSTHSPFIINSIDDAWVYELNFDEHGDSRVIDNFKSSTTDSIVYTLKKAFSIEAQFGGKSQELLDQFYEIRDEILSNTEERKDLLIQISKQLYRKKDQEINDIIDFELRQLHKITKDKLFLLQ